MTPSKTTGGNRRTVIVRLRVTVAEKEALLEKATRSGFTLSDWIRSKAIDVKPVIRKPLPGQELLVRLLAAFGKSGSNLNQVARQLNRKQENAEFELPIREIMYLLEEFKGISHLIREAIYGSNKGRDQG